MKKIYALVKDYLKDTFNFKLYLSLAILLIVLIGFNYTFNLEKSFFNSFHGTYLRGFFLAIVTGAIYLLSCFMLYLFLPNFNPFKSKGFWLSFVFLWTVFGFYRGTNLNLYAGMFSATQNEYYFIYYLIGDIDSLLIGVLPFLLVYWFYDRKKIGHFYGLTTRDVDFKPYLWMLAIMALPIFIAADSESFLQAYPKVSKARYLGFALDRGWSDWQALLVFELFYLASFLAVEVIFRGFMIYRMEKYLGDYVVLPMVITYAVIHFGKPLGETIGSIFGGLVLGILALKTKNIYGGVFIHIGVALLMELFALYFSA